MKRVVNTTARKAIKGGKLTEYGKKIWVWMQNNDYP